MNSGIARWLCPIVSKHLKRRMANGIEGVSSQMNVICPSSTVTTNLEGNVIVNTTGERAKSGCK